MDSAVNKSQFLQIFHMMGYLSRNIYDALSEYEVFLVDRMWNVLTQSNLSIDQTNLSSIKRFIFVIEGLTINQDDGKKSNLSSKVSKDLKMLFSEFKPLYLNRLA